MIDPDEGDPEPVGESFSEGQPHQQGSCQPRTERRGDPLNLLFGDPCGRESLVDHLDDQLLVGAGGQFGDHSPVFPVDVLGGDDVGTDRPPVQDGGRSFIAGCFDPEHDHRVMVRKGGLIFKKRLRQAVFFAILDALRSLMGDVMAKQL